jgi:hypothetical protein
LRNAVPVLYAVSLRDASPVIAKAVACGNPDSYFFKLPYFLSSLSSCPRTAVSLRDASPVIAKAVACGNPDSYFFKLPYFLSSLLLFYNVFSIL